MESNTELVTIETRPVLLDIGRITQSSIPPLESDEEKVDFFNHSYPELEKLLLERFEANSYRATQLFEWIYRKGVKDFDLMTNISRPLRVELAKALSLPPLKMRERLISKDGTRKYLFEVDGGDLVESVMIKQPKRMTLCVSSQVGCAMACGFCRTGMMGLKRSLTTSEIIRQVVAVIDDAANFGDMFQNIVFMGMGEPLHNFDGVTRAVKILTDPRGFGMSPRKITVSTVGLVPAIRKLAQSGVELSLAVSLNATTDEIRSQIMPINKRFPIAELLAALKELPLGKRKKITIEYVMLDGVNVTPQDRKRLVSLLHGMPVKVNLIPYNDNAGLGYKTPPAELVHDWQRFLNAHGLQATIRWSKGADIKAACGQLVTESKRVPRH